MYCTTDVTFYCDGEPGEALPKFQAMLGELAAMLRDKHPAVTAPGLDEPLTADDLHEGIDSGADLEGIE